MGRESVLTQSINANVDANRGQTTPKVDAFLVQAARCGCSLGGG
jgi:hypothetical protein